MNIFDCKSCTPPEKILDNLYLGNFINAGDKECLQNLGITHILICASYLDPMYPEVNFYISFRISLTNK